MSAIASVVPELYIEKTFDYLIPEDMQGLQRGARVLVPFGKRTLYGYVTACKEQSSHSGLKKIKSFAQTPYPLTEELFDLALWMSRYYITPLSQVLKILLPAAVKKEAKIRTQIRLKKGKTKQELINFCLENREKAPQQVALVEYMLQKKESPFLSEAIEALSISPAVAQQLVKKGVLLKEAVEITPSFFEKADFFSTPHKTLHEEQSQALAAIVNALSMQSFTPFLLHGVTGSGKTEVYLQAMQKALDLGKSVLFLIPEISLTPQTVQRIRSRFSEQIAVLHHRLSQGERNLAFQSIRKGEARIVIGARSSVFAPLNSLGLIIVDEEHDSSYKQGEEMPHYSARDVAVYRGHLASCPVILGSATPSIESYYNAKQGKYTLLPLLVRANKAALPPVRLIDMKREYEKQQGFTNFSSDLIEALKERFEKGEQALLFLNRRGYHSMQLCLSCGKAQECSRCDHTLTYYKAKNLLQCHLCGYSKPPSTKCSSCGSLDTMKYKGVGTELVEKQLQALLPEARTLRLDADSTRHKGSLEKYLKQFATGKADVLIGTQMIAKGHDFPNVTLVGILNADTSLHLPDFRAQETTFQLITQVAGRSGRGALLGEVLIQTSSPDSLTLNFAAKQDYPSFYASEIEARKMLNYPPYRHMVKVRMQGKNEGEVEELLTKIYVYATNLCDNSTTIHPVTAAAHRKVLDSFTFQFVALGENPWRLGAILQHAKQLVKIPSAYKVKIDVNPLSTFF